MDVQRLLLVDDHALFREGMAGLFAYEDDFEVVGEAADGEAALAAARELMPDLVLMDIDMPHCDGIEATRRLKQEMPYVRVVMLTVHDDDDKLFEAIKAGAQGYLVKGIRSSEMLELLRGMSHGEAPISRAMAARILEEFARTAGSARSAVGEGAVDMPAPETALTLREQEVLELVARRYTNKEIAARLVISEYTVKNHLRNILSKLHLRSRAQAARYALGRGLVAPAGQGSSHRGGVRA
ncbi:MAG: response regulator transcription factor [Chloroflexi bacterium]|nr:response regulator transcription factor [Chloroflexota bacterium]